MKEFGVPMLVTGGGGYTKHNVARCWTYETAILLDQQVVLALPTTALCDTGLQAAALHGIACCPLYLCGGLA